ncbi:MAG: PhoH family protein, partial [Paracraurococcus sp.]
TQVDLPGGQRSGLAEALRILDGVQGIGTARFDERDVVRHPLVARIVAAYGRADVVSAYGRADVASAYGREDVAAQGRTEGQGAEPPGRRGKKDQDGTGK